MIVAKDISTGRASEGGHWYDRTGKPVYEIRGKNGNMRPVTLRDARQLLLVPGYSAIAAMEHKPALERWKIEQALLAALTLPRLDGEEDQAFLSRAREDSFEQARKAAQRGTAIHAAIQGFYEGAPVDSEFLPYVVPVTEWLSWRFSGSQWNAEKSFAHPLGFGGKSDLSCVEAVVDIKCKDFSDKTAKLAYDEHCMQLAAYSEGFGHRDCAKVNLFVSTRVPGLIVPVEWAEHECAEAWEAFKCLLRLWQIRRGYNSSFMVQAA